MDACSSLWRCLHAEWRCSALQVVAAQAGRYQDPRSARCATVAKLWEELPLWEELGSELKLTGFRPPEFVRVNSLKNWSRMTWSRQS